MKNAKNIYSSGKDFIYADFKKISELEISEELKQIITKIYLPNLVGKFNITLDFDPVSKDSKISSLRNNNDYLYTIGYQGISHIIERQVFLSALRLERNVSMAEIDFRIQELDKNNIDIYEVSFLKVEVDYAERFYIDFSRNGEIFSIDPSNLSQYFLNSSIEQFANSIMSFWQKLDHENIYSVHPINVEDLNDFVSDLNRIDPKVLKIENSKWNQIVKAAFLLIEEEL